MVHIVFLDMPARNHPVFHDDDQLLCEVQLCLWKYTYERINRGGHRAYSGLRFAREVKNYFTKAIAGGDLDAFYRGEVCEPVHME